MLERVGEPLGEADAVTKDPDFGSSQERTEISSLGVTVSIEGLNVNSGSRTVYLRAPLQ